MGLPSGVFTSFTKPSNGDSRASCRENINVNTSIYEVKHASSIGFIVTIQTQKPPLPSFQLVKGSYNWNLTTPAMIDRETTPQFTFEFSATDGSLSELSVPLTLDIEDVNDNTPQFINSIYTGTIYNTAKAGDYMLTIQATDEDLNPNITYFITGGDIGNTFSLDQCTGQLTLTRPGNLNPVTTPTYTLTVQASDGKTFNTTTVTVHVVACGDRCGPLTANNGTCIRNHFCYTCLFVKIKRRVHKSDPCSSNPCNNGGACAVNGMAFTCSCTTGFHGSTCNETGPTTSDPCVSKPCTNGCTCAVSGPSFSCLCVSGTMGNTCSPIVTTAAAQNETLDQENKAESLSNLLAVYIVVPMLMLSIIVVAAIVMYKNKKRQKIADGNAQEGPGNKWFDGSLEINL